MKELITIFKKDMKLAVRSFYIYLVLFFAVMFVLVMLVAVPDDIDGDLEILGGSMHVYISDMDELDTYRHEVSSPEYTMASSRDDIIMLMQSDRNARGLYIDYADGKVIYEYIMQGYEGQRTRNLITTTTLSEAAKAMGQQVNIDTTYLNAKNAGRISMLDLMIPIFIVMESAMMGLVLVAAYVFMEKNDGTIRAFCVSPARIWQYLSAKILMFLVFGLASGLGTVLILKGFTFNILHFTLLLIVYSVFGTILGLILAAFFDNIQSSMIWILVIATLFTATTISYTTPSFSPLAIRLMPIYPMQFAMREVMYPTGNTTFIWQNILGYLSADVVLLWLTSIIYRKRIASF